MDTKIILEYGIKKKICKLFDISEPTLKKVLDGTYSGSNISKAKLIREYVKFSKTGFDTKLRKTGTKHSQNSHKSE